MPGAARIGDAFSCGDFVANGSPNVFANNLPIARKGDPTTGHACWDPNKIVTACSSVFANNKLVAKKGDMDQVHCCKGAACHNSPLITASTNVLIES